MIAFFLGAAGWLKRIIAAIPWQAWTALAVAGLLWLAVTYHRSEVEAARIAGRIAGVSDTTATFEKAQADADRIARARVVQAVAAQTVVNQESSDAFLKADSDIDRRAAAIRLRHDTAARDRAAGGVDLPASGDASAGPCPAATGDGLPFAVALPALTEAAKLQAQLNAVLDWEAAQAALAVEVTE